MSCTQAGAATTDIAYIQPDHLNSPRTVTDSAQRVIWKWAQDDPFGANAPNEDPDEDGSHYTLNLRFPGQYFDAETGLHYNYFRDYDPQTGRYIQSDPIGLVGGVNTYAHLKSDPLRLTDRYGLCPPCLVIPGVCAAGGCELIFGAAAAGIYMSTPSGKKAAKRASKIAANVIARAQGKNCSPEDECEKQRQDEEKDCRETYGEIFGYDAWFYSACMARALARYQLCKSNKGVMPDDAPPPWSDKDIE